MLWPHQTEPQAEAVMRDKGVIVAGQLLLLQTERLLRLTAAHTASQLALRAQTGRMYNVWSPLSTMLLLSAMHLISGTVTDCVYLRNG